MDTNSLLGAISGKAKREGASSGTHLAYSPAGAVFRNDGALIMLDPDTGDVVVATPGSTSPEPALLTRGPYANDLKFPADEAVAVSFTSYGRIQLLEKIKDRYVVGEYLSIKTVTDTGFIEDQTLTTTYYLRGVVKVPNNGSYHAGKILKIGYQNSVTSGYGDIVVYDVDNSSVLTETIIPYTHTNTRSPHAVIASTTPNEYFYLSWHSTSGLKIYKYTATSANTFTDVLVFDDPSLTTSQLSCHAPLVDNKILCNATEPTSGLRVLNLENGSQSNILPGGDFLDSNALFRVIEETATGDKYIISFGNAYGTADSRIRLYKLTYSGNTLDVTLEKTYTKEFDQPGGTTMTYKGVWPIVRLAEKKLGFIASYTDWEQPTATRFPQEFTVITLPFDFTVI